MTTTSNTLPKIPPLGAVLAALVLVTEDSPERTTPHVYLTPMGEPFSIVARVYHRLGGHPAVFAPVNGKVLRTAWPHIYEGDMLFLGMNEPGGVVVAEEFLVFGLLCHVQKYEDRGLPRWLAISKGLRSFRRFLLSRTSGFLVQTNGHHLALREQAHTLINRTIDLVEAAHEDLR